MNIPCKYCANRPNGRPRSDVRLRLGQIVATPGALAMCEENQINLSHFILSHHARGEWGTLDKEDIAENELSLREGFRILSAYELPGGKLYIITEADRSSTCALLPEEY